MSATIQKDIAATIKGRYVIVSRQELPAEFEKAPDEVLANLAGEYRKMVNRIDHKLAAAHNDWVVRVEMDPELSISVAEAGVIHNRKWVEFRGVVARVHQPVPRALEEAWVCTKCGAVTKTDPERIRQPRTCPCGSTNLEYDESSSILVDSQQLVLAESFEEIKGSSPPRMLDCRVDGTLTQKLNPGMRCVLGGVMRVRRTKIGKDYELLVNNAVPYRAVKNVEPPVIEGDQMERLVESFAPDIHGHLTIKESIILQLVGGSAALHRRTNINMLLVGDPGVAKSEMLREAAVVAPLGRYTAGRGATAAGLTAGMARDKYGVMYMEAGASVLTDGGLLCIDEFDKTKPTDRDALHEVLEQQTASITKLGVMVTMNARVATLAAANPKKGFWDDDLTLSQNINLPDSLVTRFDLIYNLRDVPDEEADRMIARHILHGARSDVLPAEAITAYIASVRHLKPEMTDAAADAIEKYYASERRGSGELRITARQLEAVKRLAGARAKIYRREKITIEDATRAIYLVRHMIQRTLVDPATGKPDPTKAVSGQSRSAVRAVDEALGGIEGEFTAVDVSKRVKMSIPDIERALDQLHLQGILTESSGIYRRIR